MSKIKFLFIILLCCTFVQCTTQQNDAFLEPVDYVNPYIGNISHLLVPTYPTIHLPNSMLRVYPVREEHNVDFVKGLPMIVPDHSRGSVINFMPYTGKVPQGVNNVKLSCDNERIKPYRYQVFLDGIGVNVDFVPSHQSAIYSLKRNNDRQLSLSFLLNNENVYIYGNTFTDNVPLKLLF